MAPFKSSLARSASKLFGMSRERDTSLRGYAQTSRLTDNNFNIFYLIIGGGGSGGGDNSGAGGGGGAGGYRTNYASETPGGPGGSTEAALSIDTNTNYPVVVGSGGAEPAHDTAGNPGGASNFSTIVSQGGGGGGNLPSSAADGKPGGSGGGGAGTTNGDVAVSYTHLTLPTIYSV